MQNPRGKRGSKWSNAVNFERILVEIGASLGAFERSLIKFERKSGPSDHITGGPIENIPKKKRRTARTWRYLSPSESCNHSGVRSLMVEESRDASRLPKTGTVIQSLVHG